MMGAYGARESESGSVKWVISFCEHQIPFL
jgi:hypothetical protein